MSGYNTTILHWAKYLVVVLFFTSCAKEINYEGYWAFSNETSKPCTVHIWKQISSVTEDFVNLQINPGEEKATYRDAYIQGEFQAGRCTNAVIEFSDGEKTEYTKLDGKRGNPLDEASYDVKEFDGVLYLRYVVSEDVYDN